MKKTVIVLLIMWLAMLAFAQEDKPSCHEISLNYGGP